MVPARRIASTSEGKSMHIRSSRTGHLVLAAASLLLVAHPTRAQTPPPYWPPPAPAEPDDTLYTSPFTFDVVTNGGTEDADVGPEARIAAKWQLLGGPVSIPLSAAMGQATESERQKYAPQAPGSPGAPGQRNWTALGPTRENHWQNGTPPNPQINSGRLTGILVDPSSPDTVFILAATGGVWKTTNFSSPEPTWTPKSDGIGNDGIGAGAFGKAPRTIYIGTGDAFDSFFGGAIYRSTDGGNSWSAGVQLIASVTFDLKVDTSGPSDIVLVGTNNGIFRSTNGGVSFASVGGFGNQLVWSIVRTSAGWLASMEDGFTGVGQMAISTDKGATWSLIPNGGNVFSGAGRTTLGVGAPGDAVVYAYAATTFDVEQLDLFRSTDGGLNWTAVGLATKVPQNFDFFQQDMNLMGGQAFYNQMVLVDPTDPYRNTVYLGGQLSSAKSSNGGATWFLTSTWVPLRGPPAVVGNLPYVHADFHCAAFGTFGGQPYVMFGSDGGLFVSSNGGRTWDDRKNQGLQTHQIYAMSVSGKHPDLSLIGLQDNGTLFRLPNSATWDGVIGGDGFGTGWSQANDAVSIGSIYFSDFQRSTNNPPNTQTKFSPAFAGIERSEAGFFTPLTTPTAAADPSGLEFFTYTRTRIYRTTDGASLWTVIGQAGVNFGAIAFQGQHGLSVSPVDAGRIAATGGSGFLAITLDGGATWSRPRLIGPTGVPGYGGINVASSWSGANVLWVASQSTNTAANHVVKSTNAGQTFTVADGGLPRLPIRKILADPSNVNVAYVGNVIGVYRTTDGGASWSRFGNGLPFADFSDLYLAQDGSFLRASSYGRGVWEIPLN
jgi:photosystem II stability/assembly factor-like uncharacterized protein